MSKTSFISAAELSAMVEDYFANIENPGQSENDNPTAGEKKKASYATQTPTFSGLAFALGFSSRQAFDDYERKGKFADIIKRGRLRIEMTYENKLHSSQSAGAIFALKSMGWNEKTEIAPPIDDSTKNLKIEIVETGPKPAESEKEVMM